MNYKIVVYFGVVLLLVNNTNHATQMTTSLIENVKNCDSIMTQSLEGSNSNNSNAKMNNSQESTPRTITPNPYNGNSKTF